MGNVTTLTFSPFLSGYIAWQNFISIVVFTGHNASYAKCPSESVEALLCWKEVCFGCSKQISLTDSKWLAVMLFSLLFTYAWLQSPMDTQLVAESDRCHAFCTAWRNFMSSVMFTGHSALLVACPFPVYYYLVDVFVPRPTPTSNLSLAAPTLDCSLSCLACPGSKLVWRCSCLVYYHDS